ncbi:glycoside hydrolase family 18 protein [Bacillus carboniphilus]|uniref:Glycoside hydrolase family 18 protein n=1 Tax=Bacillus carboniphilus TaxID=86663 RepID=A0ABN0WA52_9BACI
MRIHVVQYGDTLWKIANQYQVPINRLVEVNKLPSTNAIIPGLALYIPEASPTIIRHYQLKAGDMLWRIANQFQTTVQSILRENPNVNPTQLYIGQHISIPTSLKNQLQTLGFYVPYNVNEFLPKFRELARNLTYLAVVSYSFTNEGYAYVLLDDTTIVSESNRIGVVPLLMIRNVINDEFSAELVGGVLEDPQKRRNLVASLLNFVRQRGYGGVSLDLEFIPPQRRGDFISFLRELKIALGSLLLHVNVHAKSEDLPTNRIVGGYDYRAIGQISDIVAVMTIDYGYPTGPPDPIAPIWWMNNVVRYATNLIDRRKLQIAFPLYGYDKRVIDNQTSARSVLGMQNLAISTSTTIQYDTNAESPWFRYWRGAEEHVVWFEDIRSYSVKYGLVDFYQLLGVTYWQLGLDAPHNWAYVNDNIIVDKIR